MSADEGPVFVDTHVLVYAFDVSAGDKRDRARSLLDRLWTDKRGCLSIQVLQEFYVAVTQKVQRPIDTETAIELIRDLAFWQLHEPVAEDVLGAITLQQRHRTSFWDAMILWSAQQLGCNTIWSENLSQRQDYDGVQVIDPFGD